MYQLTLIQREIGENLEISMQSYDLGRFKTLLLLWDQIDNEEGISVVDDELQSQILTERETTHYLISVSG